MVFENRVQRKILRPEKVAGNRVMEKTA